MTKKILLLAVVVIVNFLVTTLEGFVPNNPRKMLPLETVKSWQYHIVACTKISGIKIISNTRPTLFFV